MRLAKENTSWGYTKLSDVIFTLGHVPESTEHSTTETNAFIERFIRSIKEECLDRVIPLGEARLRELIREYMIHYHVERPHQGLDVGLIQPADDRTADGAIVRRERLGGLLNYYHREAA